MAQHAAVRASDPRPGIRVIALDDAPTRNALTADVLAGLQAEFAYAGDDDAVKVIVLTGTGEIFCSGGDTRGMGGQRPPPLARKQSLWRSNQRLMRQIRATDKPIIAAINGPAIGAGADLALHADIRLIAEGAYLQWSYVRLGVVPGAGGAWALPRLVGSSVALDLLWSGRRVDAGEATNLGIARSVAADRLGEAAVDLAESFADQPTHALQLIKRMVQQSADIPFDAALDAASSHFAVLQETDDHQEAVLALREKRAPRFSGS